MIYLTAKRVISLNQRVLNEVENYPSKFQSDGREVLDEIITKAKASKDISTVAAVYLYELNRKHVFNSANKRTAFLAAEIFLRSNGVYLNISDEQASAFSKDIRNGKYTLEQVVGYIAKNTQTKQKTDVN